MIHQLIFAHPKPGMSEQEFQRYWLEVHAPNYAAKIPQIKRYLIDHRIPFGPEPEDPNWSGVAEIWLPNGEEQIASLQTPEFLEGARLDEPKWAAFWRTVVLDTDAHVVVEGPGMVDNPAAVKLILLVKRREGTSLADFRARSLDKHAEVVQEIPGLRRYLQGHTVDGAYGVGEAVLDAAYQLWFDDIDALTKAAETPEFARAMDDLKSFVEPRYVHQMAVQEHWVIGPEAR